MFFNFEGGPSPEDLREKGIKSIIYTEQTRETRLPGTGETRGALFRFERAQILKAYRLLRKELHSASSPAERVKQQDRLQEFRQHAGQVERELDELNRQYYESEMPIEIEVEGERYVIPVTVLDLNEFRGREKEKVRWQSGESIVGKESKSESNEDTRIPYVCIGAIGTNPKMMAAFLRGFALRGQKIFSIALPEQKTAETPPGFIDKLKERHDFSLHAAIVKKVVEKLGLEKINLIGVSMGGGIVLEVASDPNFNRIHDLIAVEPVGFEAKSRARLAGDFVRHVAGILPSAETRLKAYMGGKGVPGKRGEFPTKSGSLGADIEIIRRKQFTEEKLSRIRPEGRYQIWVATKSAFVDADKIEKVLGKTATLREEQPQKSAPVEFYRVKGGSHNWPFLCSFGFARLLEAPRGAVPHTLSNHDFENSAAAAILEERFHRVRGSPVSASGDIEAILSET